MWEHGPLGCAQHGGALVLVDSDAIDSPRRKGSQLAGLFLARGLIASGLVAGCCGGTVWRSARGSCSKRTCMGRRFLIGCGGALALNQCSRWTTLAVRKGMQSRHCLITMVGAGNPSAFEGLWT